MRAMPSPLGRVVERKAKPGEVLCLFRHGSRRATFSKGEGFGAQNGLPGNRQAAELILLFAIQVSLSAVDIVDQRSSIEFHILICVIRVIITTLRIP